MAKFRAQRIKTIARFDIPASLARGIGRFLVTWAHFEHYVQAIVWSELDLGASEGRLAVREPRVTDRLDMIRDVGQVRNFELDYVLLADIRKRADPLAGKRHLLAHSLWTYDKAQWCALITRGAWAETQEEVENLPTGSKTVEPEARPVTTQDVREWTAQTETLIDDIKRLSEQPSVLPPKPPKKPKPSKKK